MARTETFGLNFNSFIEGKFSDRPLFIFHLPHFTKYMFLDPSLVHSPMTVTWMVFSHEPSSFCTVTL